MFSLENLYRQYYACRRNKRQTVNALRFEVQQERHLLALKEALETRTYHPSRSVCFVATLDDPTRFATSRQVAAYLGLVPRVYQSGTTNYHGQISKEGDKLVRWLFVEAPHVLLTRTRRSCSLKRWGFKLAKKRGQGKANVAVAHKLAIVFHRLWVTGASYEPMPT